jgi:isopentenyl-diphosphate delta-isomerase
MPRPAERRPEQAHGDPIDHAPASPVRDPRAKSRHIDVCLTQPVEYDKTTGLEAYELVNQTLPELSLAAIDLSATLAGRTLRAPLMIGPMTGGTEQGLALNRLLARAAQHFGLAMGVGSQRVALERPELAGYFQVRDVAPDIALFSNFGAAQLARGWGAPEARRAVEMIGADALFIHFNAVQEAIQGGDRDFRGVAQRLQVLCRELAAEGIPVFAREVCFGLSVEAAERLLDCGVAGLDCSGAGGTSWAKVEAYCAESPRRRELGLRLGEWGIPTARSILNARAASVHRPLVASGGLRKGIDLAIALALGADIGAMARPFLLAASKGEAALHEFIEDVLTELRVCMFGAGAGNAGALRGKVRHVGEVA